MTFPLPVEGVSRERFAAMLDALEAAYDYGSQERIAAARAACLAAFDAMSADAERMSWLDMCSSADFQKIIGAYETCQDLRVAIDAARAHQEN